MQLIQENLSRFRNEIKGFAILWIVFFHMKLSIPWPVGVISDIGYGGVDLFFFLSGIGMYVSYGKSRNSIQFYKKRAIRLLPAYYPVCLLWLIVLPVFDHYATADMVRFIAGNVTLLGFFADTPVMFSWYISALAVSILVTPLFYHLISVQKHRARIWLLLLLFCFAFGLCFIHDDRYMAVSRLPVFLIGMMTAAFKPNEEKKEKTGRILAGNLAALLVGLLILLITFRRYSYLLNDFAMYWHPFILIAPSLCVLLAFGFGKMGKLSGLLKPLRFLGEASYEIFLWNIVGEILCKRLFAQPWIRVATGFLSILVGYIYHFVMNSIQKSNIIKLR